MADGLCGPSNPLQNLQKQSSADRTLQQDRLISRQQPAQGFRSRGPNAGVLDSEFESFQAGQISFSGPENHGINQPSFLAGHGPHQNGNLHEPTWVGDFANMNLAGPSSSMIHPATAHAQHPAQHGGHNGAWQAEFQRQNMQLSNQGQIQHDSRLRGQATGPGWRPQYRSDASLINFQNQQSQPHQGQVAEDPFGKEEWDKLFERFEQAEALEKPAATPVPMKEEGVRDSAVAEEVKGQEEFGLGQDITINQSSENPPETQTDDRQETPRIGADLIINPITDVPREQRPTRRPDEENDALARTAGNLLSSISNNQDPKFQNSQFLRLMQQFRDREVAVQGNKIVGNSMGVELDGNGNGELDSEERPFFTGVGVVSS